MATVDIPNLVEGGIDAGKSNLSQTDTNQENENPNIPATTSAETQDIPLQEIKKADFQSSVNEAFAMEDENKQEIIPPVSYHDIMPELLMKAETKDHAPQYSRFGLVHVSYF
jgi:hypothetical protein